MTQPNLTPIDFLSALSDFAKTPVWAGMKQEVEARYKGRVQNAANQPDPMAGRLTAAACELMWVVSYVDGAASRMKLEVEKSKQDAREAEEELQQQQLAREQSELSEPPMTTE